MSWSIRIRGELNSFPQKSSIIIGRSEDCDLKIQSRSVDHKHAIFGYDGDKKIAFVKDLESQNGTYLNERRLTAGEAVPVVVRDIVKVGYDNNVLRIEDVPKGVFKKKYDGVVHHPSSAEQSGSTGQEVSQRSVQEPQSQGGVPSQGGVASLPQYMPYPHMPMQPPPMLPSGHGTVSYVPMTYYVPVSAGGMGVPAGGMGVPAGGMGVPAGGMGVPAGGMGVPAGGMGVPAGGMGVPAGGMGVPAGGMGVPAGGMGVPVNPQALHGASGLPSMVPSMVPSRPGPHPPPLLPGPHLTLGPRLTNASSTAASMLDRTFFQHVTQPGSTGDGADRSLVGELTMALLDLENDSDAASTVAQHRPKMPTLESDVSSNFSSVSKVHSRAQSNQDLPKKTDSLKRNDGRRTVDLSGSPSITRNTSLYGNPEWWADDVKKELEENHSRSSSTNSDDLQVSWKSYKHSSKKGPRKVFSGGHEVRSTDEGFAAEDEGSDSNIDIPLVSGLDRHTATTTLVSSASEPTFIASTPPVSSVSAVVACVSSEPTLFSPCTTVPSTPSQSCAVTSATVNPVATTGVYTPQQTRSSSPDSEYRDVQAQGEPRTESKVPEVQSGLVRSASNTTVTLRPLSPGTDFENQPNSVDGGDSDGTSQLGTTWTIAFAEDKPKSRRSMPVLTTTKIGADPLSKATKPRQSLANTSPSVNSKAAVSAKKAQPTAKSSMSTVNNVKSKSVSSKAKTGKASVLGDGSPFLRNVTQRRTFTKKDTPTSPDIPVIDPKTKSSAPRAKNSDKSHKVGRTTPTVGKPEVGKPRSAPHVRKSLASPKFPVTPVRPKQSVPHSRLEHTALAHKGRKPPRPVSSSSQPRSCASTGSEAEFQVKDSVRVGLLLHREVAGQEAPASAHVLSAHAAGNVTSGGGRKGSIPTGADSVIVAANFGNVLQEDSLQESPTSELPSKSDFHTPVAVSRLAAAEGTSFSSTETPKAYPPRVAPATSSPKDAEHQERGGAGGGAGGEVHPSPPSPVARSLDLMAGLGGDPPEREGAGSRGGSARKQWDQPQSVVIDSLTLARIMEVSKSIAELAGNSFQQLRSQGSPRVQPCEGRSDPGGPEGGINHPLAMWKPVPKEASEILDILKETEWKLKELDRCKDDVCVQTQTMQPVSNTDQLLTSPVAGNQDNDMEQGTQYAD